jgi:CheY-like chemotaxis protein
LEVPPFAFVCWRPVRAPSVGPGAHMEPAVVVLIAEDEAAIRDILKLSFEDGGFSVILASSGEEAIAAMEADRGLRALITDIKLGSKVTGWDVARHGRELNPDLPVVYVTGSEGHDWASLGVPNSVLIEKPFAPAQVLTAVSQLLNIGNTPGA